MCGIVGMMGANAVNQDLYDALTILQHRGQDAAGILTSNTRQVFLRKDNGLVRDVIQEPHMKTLIGRMGLGHVRYPTAGSPSPQESQPFYVNAPYGLGLVHNGNLTNTDTLKDTVVRLDRRHLNTTSDSEILLNVVAHELAQISPSVPMPRALFSAMEVVYTRLEGAYSVLLLIQGVGLVGFRDAFGIRPLVVGIRSPIMHSDEVTQEVMLASESIALDALGFTLLGDVAPGEVVFVDLSGKIHRKLCARSPKLLPCIFEYIYLARPDSVLDGISVYAAHWEMGVSLAQIIQLASDMEPIDVVIPIPETSRTAAQALSQRLGLPYAEGFIKNRYIGRTFIMPGQQIRRSAVRLKLNPIRQVFAGKNVLLVDDSIVRGTTSREIIQMARDAGAKHVYFASAAPAVRYPNVYGIDTPSAQELVAHNCTTEEVARTIGADRLFYPELSDVVSAILRARSVGCQVEHFEDSMFTGVYCSGHITPAYLSHLVQLRSSS